LALHSMNLRVLPGLLAWTFVSPFAAACGPFFPDTVLDKPQAALDVPPVSYLAELCRIAGRSLPSEQAHVSDQSTFLSQIPKELAELRQYWTERQVDPADIERRLLHYQDIRQALLRGLDSTGPNLFPTQQEALRSLSERPLDNEYPQEVADYVEAARLYGMGKSDEARALWKAILERPIEQRRLRCVWAAWMLAKTSPDETECLAWYERVEKEATAGGTDAIGLVAASMGWRAMLSTDPVAKFHLYYDGFLLGDVANVSELRRCSDDLLEQANPESLAKAAADPLVRQLIHLNLQTTLDGPRSEASSAADPTLIPQAWLDAVKQYARTPLPDGARLAWALYALGNFEESRRWLTLSDQSDPLSLWLGAKFDLRAGKLDKARDHLNAAIQKLRSRDDWAPTNPSLQGYWSGRLGENLQRGQGRLLADAGLVALGREDYLSALQFLHQGGYAGDAAYIAEHLVPTSSLLKHVKAVAPRDSDRPAGEPNYFDRYAFAKALPEVDPATCLEAGQVGRYQWLRNPDNRLRYELARRLAREGRMSEAIAFMPPQLQKLATHYAALDRAQRSKRYKSEALAAILWRQARIHRWWGAQLFSTDSFPDGGVYDWNWPARNLGQIRSLRNGWTEEWSGGSRFCGTLRFVAAQREKDKAVPLVRADEIERLSIPRLKYEHRYHYRTVAADLAWRAARLLPDGDPRLALLYNTAGQWVETCNPDLADRFYETLMKRCPNTEIATRANARHWFDREAEPLQELPGLPAGLMPKPLENGGKPGNPDENLNDEPSDSTDLQ